MALTYSKLMDIKVMTIDSNLITASVIYTNPANTKTYISEIEIHNTNGTTSASVALFLVPNIAGNTGSATISNETVKLTLPPYDTIFIEPKYPYVLESINDSFFGVASTGSVNISMRGGKEIL